MPGAVEASKHPTLSRGPPARAYIEELVSRVPQQKQQGVHGLDG
jgi:hypothetical protein